MKTKGKVTKGEELSPERESSSILARIWKFIHTPQGRTVFALAVLSGVFAVGYKAGDNLVMHQFITSDDRLSAASTYLIIGGWAGVLTRIIYSYLSGHKIDERFKGLHPSYGTRRMHTLAFVSGGLSALGTLATLLSAQEADPSIMIALGSFQVVFMVWFDKKKRQSLPPGFLSLVILTLVGCGMASMQGSWKFPIVAMLLVFFISSPINGYTFHLGQEGGRESDSVLFTFWRFVWLAIWGTVGAFVIAIVRQKAEVLLEVMGEAMTIGTLSVIAAVMLFVYFNDTTETMAKSHAGSSLTLVFIILFATQILLGNPITIFGEVISPGMFGGLPEQNYVWPIRLFGLGLVGFGVHKLRSKLAQSKPQ